MRTDTLLEILKTEKFEEAVRLYVHRKEPYATQGGLLMWYFDIIWRLETGQPLLNDNETKEIIALTKLDIVSFGSFYLFMVP